MMRHDDTVVLFPGQTISLQTYACHRTVFGQADNHVTVASDHHHHRGCRRLIRLLVAYWPHLS